MGRMASSILALLIACSMLGQDAAPVAHLASGSLKVHFIYVGQADAILVQTPSGKNMLVDAGNNDDALQYLWNTDAYSSLKRRNPALPTV